MLDSADVTPLDGRVARSRRTRAAIVEALVDLLEEGNPQPTIEEIAARAGVAPRTVFQHYADREALFAAVSAHREAHLQELMGTIDPARRWRSASSEVVAQRARVYEWIAAVRRGALLMEPFSPAVHASLEAFRAAKREELARVFATELAACADEGERAALAAALGAVRVLVGVGRAAHPAGPGRRRRRGGAGADAARRCSADSRVLTRHTGGMLDRARVRAPELMAKVAGSAARTSPCRSRSCAGRSSCSTSGRWPASTASASSRSCAGWSGASPTCSSSSACTRRSSRTSTTTPPCATRSLATASSIR